MVGAALLGSMLGFFSLQGLAEGQVEAEAVCSGPTINNDTCVATACSFVTLPRRRRHHRHRRLLQAVCLRAETLGGDNTCVDLRGETCPDTDQYDSDTECGVGEVCIKIGGCCGNTGRNLCVKQCG